MRGWLGGLAALVMLIVVSSLVVIAVVSSAGGDTPHVDLEVGDCFDLPDEASTGSVDEVDVVDCDEPHEAEVVFVGELREGDEPYPSDEELFVLADRACRQTPVVVSSDFGLLPIAPTVELWESFEGRFLCVAVPFGGGRVTGSAVVS